MAIVICPECNEKISSSVSQCVHCGAKITVCPECGKIYMDHPNTCAECGYILKKTEEIASDFSKLFIINTPA